MMERAACKMSSTNLPALGITSPVSSFADSSMSSTAMSPTQANNISNSAGRTTQQIPPPPQVLLKAGTPVNKKPYVGPVPSLKTHQLSTIPSVLSNTNNIPLANAPLHPSPRSIAYVITFCYNLYFIFTFKIRGELNNYFFNFCSTQAVCKLPPQMVDTSTACTAVGATMEFSALQSDRQPGMAGSLDDLFGEETRGERPSNIAPPGRTYECEVRPKTAFVAIYKYIKEFI